MPVPFLDIQTKEDSAAQIAALLGVPTKFKYSAEEWNLMRDKINELHGIIANTDLGNAAENNIKVKKINLWIDWTAPGTTEQKVIAAINAKNPFSIEATDLVYFYCYKNQTMYQPQTGYNPEIHYWIFTLGKGDYGTGNTPITVNDKPILYRGYTKSNNETETYNLGEIGQTPIAEHINSSAASYTNNIDSYTIFDVTRNQETFSYLFLGTEYLIGNYQNEPEAVEVFANQFRNLSAEPPAPTNTDDFLTKNELDKTLYDRAKYYLTDVIANANISGNENFALVETDTDFYFASKTTNEETFEGSSIKPHNLEGIRFQLGTPDLTQNGYNFWQLSTASAVNYLQNNGFVWFQLWQKGGGIEQETDPTVPQHVKDISTTNISNWDEAFQKNLVSGSITGDANKTLTLTHRDGNTLSIQFQDISGTAADGVVNTLDFNSATGVISATTSEGDIVTVNIDNRYSLIGHTHTIGDIANLASALAGKTETGGYAGTAQDLKDLIDAIQTFSGNYADLTGKPDLSEVLKYTAQNITEQYQWQARENINAAEKYAKIDVTGSRNLSPDDNGKLLLIDGNVTLTFPASLPSDFNFNYKVKGGVTLTIANGSKTIVDREFNIITQAVIGEFGFGTVYQTGVDEYLIEGDIQ